MKTKPKNTRFTLLALFIATMMIFNLTGVATAAFYNKNTALDQGSNPFVEVAKQAKPAVVHIRVEQTRSVRSPYHQYSEQFFNHPFFDQFFGPEFKRQFKEPQKRTRQGQGSGFIISKDGYILTNNHVVEQADTITVIMADEKEYDGELVGTDPQSDIALIKIDAGKNLPTLPLGNSDTLEVAEWVIAIGNPFGLSQTVTVGVVSAKGRNRVGLNDYENFIQTDAAINPGNSGGPLLNVRGEVVGINSALYSRTGGYMGIGFAIPINMAKNIKDQLADHGSVTRGWLGVFIQPMSEELADSFGLDENKGILVSDVQTDSPAEKAGLQQGDVIISVQGEELKDPSALRNKVALILPGTKVPVEVIRNGKVKKLTVKIGKQPEDFGSSHSVSKPFDQYGLSLQNLTEELAAKFGFAKDQGVLINDVKLDSPASKAGLRAGYLIEEINHQPVANIKQVKRILKASKKKGTLFRVNTGQAKQYVVLVKE